MAKHKNKEKNGGSNRQAKADTQDPGAFGDTWTLDPSTISFTSPQYSYGSGTSLTPAAAAPAEEKLDLESVESEFPILAHRAAILRFDGTDKHFGAVSFGSHFGVDAEAARLHGGYPNVGGWTFVISTTFGQTAPTQPHDAPHPDCSCGFYALPPDLEPTYEGYSYVTLMVELSGTVIEHEKGYRAGHQRVIECKLPACPYCGSRAEVLTVAEHVMQQATCEKHVPVAAPGQVFVAAADLANLIPVPIVRAGRVPVQS